MLVSRTCLGMIVKFCPSKLENILEVRQETIMNIKVLTLSAVASAALLISACGGEAPKTNTNAPANKPATNAAPTNAAPTNAAPTNAAPTNAAPSNAKPAANMSDKKDEKAPANVANTEKKDGDMKKDDAKKDK